METFLRSDFDFLFYLSVVEIRYKINFGIFVALESVKLNSQIVMMLFKL